MKAAKKSILHSARAFGLASLAALVTLTGAGMASAQGADDQPPSAAAQAGGHGCHPARDDVQAGPQTFTFDGVERTYLLTLPTGYNGKKAHPMVFNFHGGGGNQASTEAYTGMGRIGAARGYIVVTPSALGSPAGWNLFSNPAEADDYGFIDALASDLSERLCVDTDRVFAAGHSNGSAFTGLLSCKAPYRFAAVAMVAAFIPPAYAVCPSGVKPSVLAFHGTEDPGIPYEGGWVEGVTEEGEFFVPGVRDTLDDYADAYGCRQPVKEDEPAPNVLRHRYDKCDDRSRAMLYSIIGGGHEWPGAAGGSFSATDAILDFLKKTKPRSW